MTLGRDVAAGLGYSLVALVVGLAVVPFYIRYLGVEAYGLVGFHAALQGMLQMLDLGLGAATSREVARAMAHDDLPRARTLLHSLAWVYWTMAVLIGVAFVVGAPWIASGWLNAGALPQEAVAEAVLLIGLLIAFRWPSSLYFGALTGARRLTIASGLGIAWSILANVGALLVLVFWSATIQAFFMWQAGVAIAYTIGMQASAWWVLSGRRKARFEWPAVRSIWRFAFGMSAVAFTGSLFTQLDKLVLSKFVSLTEFGYYTLATLLAGVLYRLIGPLFNAVYPRFSMLVAKGEEAQLAQLYRSMTSMLTIVWFPASMALALCAEPLVLLWTGDPEIAAHAAPMMALLAVGSGLHGVMYFPYALQLAYGVSRLPLVINLLLMVIQLPLLLYLVPYSGGEGAALAWMILHLLYVPLGTWLTHRRLLPGLALPWLGRDVGLPLAVSAGAGALALPGISYFEASPLVQLTIGAAAALLALLISLASSSYKPSQLRAALAS